MRRVEYCGFRVTGFCLFLASHLIIYSPLFGFSFQSNGSISRRRFSSLFFAILSLCFPAPPCFPPGGAQTDPKSPHHNEIFYFKSPYLAKRFKTCRQNIAEFRNFLLSFLICSQNLAKSSAR